MQNETKFKISLRKKLDQIPYSVWFKIQQRSIRGVPDFLGCVNGVFIALELKTDKGKLDKLQQHYLMEIAAAGGYARMVAPKNQEEVLEDLFKIATGRK